MQASEHPLRGLWRPQQLRNPYYGPGVVSSHLSKCLPGSNSRAIVITATSIGFTPLPQLVEDSLGPHHVLTLSRVSGHAPIQDLRDALARVQHYPNIDTIISVGGGATIDACKWICFQMHENAGRMSSSQFASGSARYLRHIAIPTTLSAAECTAYAAYTDEEGMKQSVGGHPALAPSSILYDPEFAAHTPRQLWLTSGVRALDHAVELMYHPSTTEVPAKAMSMYAFGAMFDHLYQARTRHPHDADITTRGYLAAFAGFQFLGGNMTSGLGLSHALGYALGAPYNIPHGVTSCLTLGRVVKLKARENTADAEQIARLLPHLHERFDNVGSTATDKQQRDREDALKVGDAIVRLVQDLGLETSLTEYEVQRDQVGVIVGRALGSTVGGSVAGMSEADHAVSILVNELFDNT